MAALEPYQLSKYHGRLDIFIKNLQSDDGIEVRTQKINNNAITKIKIDFNDPKNFETLQALKNASLLDLKDLYQSIQGLSFIYDGKVLNLSNFYKTSEYSSKSNVNIGIISEVIFASAIAARFSSTKKLVRIKDIKKTLHSIKWDDGNGFVEFDGETLTPNTKNKIKLTVRTTIASAKNIQDIKKIENTPQVKNLFRSCAKYANSIKPASWAKTLQVNEKNNIIEVLADGINDQKKSKIDIQVFLSNETYERRALDINISLKCHETRQIGQVGGDCFEKQKNLWDKILGLDIETMRGVYIENLENNNIKQSVTTVYKLIKKEFDKKMRSEKNKTFMKQRIFEGINHFATLGDESVEIVHLKNGNYKILDTFRLKNYLMNNNLKMKLIQCPNGLPKISFEDEEKNTLLVIRPRTEIKGGGTLYLRTYIEKGLLFDAVTKIQS